MYENIGPAHTKRGMLAQKQLGHAMALNVKFRCVKGALMCMEHFNCHKDAAAANPSNLHSQAAVLSQLLAVLL